MPKKSQTPIPKRGQCFASLTVFGGLCVFNPLFGVWSLEIWNFDVGATVV
jgi:hypothetical protein